MSCGFSGSSRRVAAFQSSNRALLGLPAMAFHSVGMVFQSGALYPNSDACCLKAKTLGEPRSAPVFEVSSTVVVWASESTFTALTWCSSQLGGGGDDMSRR